MAGVRRSWNPLEGRVFPAGSVVAAGVVLLLAGLTVPWIAVWGGAIGFDPPLPVQYRPALVVLPESGGRLLKVFQTEVTQAQYRAVTGESPSDCDYGCGNDLPVQNVSWFGAVSYLNRLSALEGLPQCYVVNGEDVYWPDPACEGWRLPTEVEWEYAARADTTTAWSFGEEEGEIDRYAWTSNNAGFVVHPVGKLEANPWRLYDMHGNVWEWAYDWYGDARGDDASMVTLSSQVGPDSGLARVMRGGAFLTTAQLSRSSNRDGDRPVLRSRSVGFRGVRGGIPGP